MRGTNATFWKQDENWYQSSLWSVSIKCLRRNPCPSWVKPIWIFTCIVIDIICARASEWSTLAGGKGEGTAVWPSRVWMCWDSFCHYSPFFIFMQHWQRLGPMEISGTHSATCFLLCKVIKCILLVSSVYSFLIKQLEWKPSVLQLQRTRAKFMRWEIPHQKCTNILKQQNTAICGVGEHASFYWSHRNSITSKWPSALTPIYQGYPQLVHRVSGSQP